MGLKSSDIVGSRDQGIKQGADVTENLSLLCFTLFGQYLFFQEICLLSTWYKEKRISVSWKAVKMQIVHAPNLETKATSSESW